MKIQFYLFCERKNKGVFILCLTSNHGSSNFQNKKIGKNELFIHVAKLASKLNNNGNIGLVVGATKYDKMNNIKVVSGDMPWLIPGVGFQGGSLKDSIAIGSKNSSIALINSSRSIIYAGDGSIKDIKLAAENFTNEIRKFMKSKEVLDLLEWSGAIMKGHFKLTSGKHSNQYIEKFRLLENPIALDKICSSMSKLFEKNDVDLVVSAAIGGILVAGGVGRHLNVKHIFSERINKKMCFKRGFNIEKSKCFNC